MSLLDERKPTQIKCGTCGEEVQKGPRFFANYFSKQAEILFVVLLICGVGMGVLGAFLWEYYQKWWAVF